MRRIVLAHGAYCELYERWLGPAEARALFAALSHEIPFAQRSIRLFGREVQQPRLSAWLGEPEAAYRYSQTLHLPGPLGPVLTDLLTRLNQALQASFNSVLCNLYRDGRDAMGLHRDNEPELGPCPVIASLSLGATRTFRLRPVRAVPGPGLDLPLANGSLLVMRGTVQQHYRHGVYREARVCEPRINLTFRKTSAALQGIASTQKDDGCQHPAPVTHGNANAEGEAGRPR